MPASLACLASCLESLKSAVARVNARHNCNLVISLQAECSLQLNWKLKDCPHYSLEEEMAGLLKQHCGRGTTLRTLHDVRILVHLAFVVRGTATGEVHRLEGTVNSNAGPARALPPWLVQTKPTAAPVHSLCRVSEQVSEEARKPLIVAGYVEAWGEQVLPAHGATTLQELKRCYKMPGGFFAQPWMGMPSSVASNVYFSRGNDRSVPLARMPELERAAFGTAREALLGCGALDVKLKHFKQYMDVAHSTVVKSTKSPAPDLRKQGLFGLAALLPPEVMMNSELAKHIEQELFGEGGPAHLDLASQRHFDFLQMPVQPPFLRDPTLAATTGLVGQFAELVRRYEAALVVGSKPLGQEKRSTPGWRSEYIIAVDTGGRPRDAAVAADEVEDSSSSHHDSSEDASWVELSSGSSSSSGFDDSDRDDVGGKYGSDDDGEGDDDDGEEEEEEAAGRGRRSRRSAEVQRTPAHPDVLHTCL
jgi:hypothetical protein